MKLRYFLLSSVVMYTGVLCIAMQKALPAPPRLSTSYFQKKGDLLAQRFLQELDDTNKQNSFLDLHCSILESVLIYMKGPGPLSLNHLIAYDWLQKYAKNFQDKVEQSYPGGFEIEIPAKDANPNVIDSYCKRKVCQRFYALIKELLDIDEGSGPIENHKAKVIRAIKDIELEKSGHMLGYYFFFGQKFAESYMLSQARLPIVCDMRVIEDLEQEYLAYCHTLIKRLGSKKFSKNYYIAWHYIYVFCQGVKSRVQTLKELQTCIRRLDLKAREKWGINFAVAIMKFVAYFSQDGPVETNNAIKEYLGALKKLYAESR